MMRSSAIPEMVIPFKLFYICRVAAVRVCAKMHFNRNECQAHEHIFCDFPTKFKTVSKIKYVFAIVCAHISG